MSIVLLKDATPIQIDYLIALHAEQGNPAKVEKWFMPAREHGEWMFCTTPAQAQPLIESKRICTNAYIKPEEGWNACVYIDKARHHHVNGDTALIAAMRCYASLVYGKEAEVPSWVK